MTQSVTFEFTSPQFDIESGKIIFTKGARFNSTGEFESRDEPTGTHMT